MRSAQKESLNSELVSSIFSAASKMLQSSTSEFVSVWGYPPAKIHDTLPPRFLADLDSKFVHVGNVTIHYKETTFISEGVNAELTDPKPDIPTILLLHGFAGSVFSWRFVMDSLSKSFPSGCRVIAFDRPPFGLTSRPVSVSENFNPYTNSGAGKLTLDLMEALSVKNAFLVGHSAGASVAIEAAVQGRERVQGLILLSPSVLLRGDALKKADLQTQLRLLYTRTLLQVPGVGLNYIRFQYYKRRDEVLQGKSLGYFDPSFVTKEAIEGYVLPMKSDSWDVGALTLYQNLKLSDYREKLQNLKLPVCIIQGKEDRVVTEESALALRGEMALHTSTEYHVLHRCGHLPQEERPLDFVVLTSRFVTHHWK